MPAPVSSPAPGLRAISTVNNEVMVPHWPGDATRIQAYFRLAGGSFGAPIFDSQTYTDPYPAYRPTPSHSGEVYEFKTTSLNGTEGTDSAVVSQASFGPIPPLQLINWNAATNTVTVLFTLPSWNASSAGVPGVQSWNLLPTQPTTPASASGTDHFGTLTRQFVLIPGQSYTFALTFTDAYFGVDGAPGVSYKAGDPLPVVGQLGTLCQQPVCRRAG